MSGYCTSDRGREGYVRTPGHVTQRRTSARSPFLSRFVSLRFVSSHRRSRPLTLLWGVCPPDEREREREREETSTPRTLVCHPARERARYRTGTLGHPKNGQNVVPAAPPPFNHPIHSPTHRPAHEKSLTPMMMHRCIRAAISVSPD